jgi:hypothetical protein
MGYTRRFFIAVTAALMAAALWPAAPAAADPSCPRSHHCGFVLGIGSDRHAFYSSDPDFRDNYFPSGVTVDNNIQSASNSTSGNYRSVYYYGYNYSNYNFCVNPGGRVEAWELTNNGVRGDYIGQADESGSLLMVVGSSAACFS